MRRFYHNVAAVVMGPTLRSLIAGLVLLYGAGIAASARAQQFNQIGNLAVAGVGTAPGVTVLSRLRPEYDYPDVNLGAITVRPDIVSSTGYDDNVLGRTAARGSALQQTEVNVVAATNWSRNSLNTNLQVTDYRFLDQPRQSYTDWTASSGGTYLIGRDTISLNYMHQNLNQTPRDLNVALVDSTIAYRIDTIDLSYGARLNRLTLKPGLMVSRYNFDDGLVGGVPYRQAYRNRSVYTPELTGSYELAPQRDIVVVVRNASAAYKSRDANQPVRDYNDTSVLAGLDYQARGPWKFHILAGYETRSFTSQSFKTIQAPVAELALIWMPTGLTTLTGTLSRRVADSADETTAGLTATSASLAVDHELRRNVLLHGQTDLEVDTYGQNGGSQTLYTVGAGTTWLLNRHARLGATYAFTARESGATGLLGGSTIVGTAGQMASGNYTENRFLLQLRLGL